MDRWGYIDWWKKQERRRARLVPGWVEACILALVLLGIWAGPRIGLRLNTKPLGWLCGALIIVALSCMLVLFGFRFSM